MRKLSKPPRWAGPLIALVAFPLFLVVLVLAVPYLAVVRTLQALGIIKEMKPSATWWSGEDVSCVEIAVPYKKQEIAEAVVRHLVRSIDPAASSRNLEFGTTSRSWLFFAGQREPIELNDADPTDEDLRGLTNAAGAPACVYVSCMKDQGTVIANVSIYAVAGDAAAVMETSLASAPGALNVRAL